MTRLFVRLLPAAIFLLLFANSAVAQCEDPIIFNADLSDSTVQCPGDLPTECDLTVTASRGATNCILGEARSAFSSCVGTTAEGTGEDGAIVLFDVNGDPNDDRYFVPTAEGITLTQFENGVAQVTGQVQQTTNPNAILNITMVYDQGVSGDVWDGGFKHAQTCPVTSTITDTWTIYILNSGLSYFTGEGDLDGTLLTLTHAPSSEYFGFQVGEMANDRNCNEGAGGWFSYSGQMNGQTIQGAQGDILLDLSCTSGSVDPCAEDGPSVTLIYTAIDVACGDALTVEQVITRDDTTDPIFDNPPADETVACADGEPAVPTLTASDNCEGDDGVPSVTYQGQSSQYDILCTGSYKVDRTWTATDCSGNTTPYTQTITMVDLVAPVIVGGADYTAECDGAGNTMELEAFLADQGGAAATDDCGTVSWSHDYQEGDLSDGCGATGTVDVIFTASDDCGNESTIQLTFTIVDTGAPTLTADAVVEVDCALYDEETIYGASANDLCGDADVVLVSVNEVSSSCAGSYIHTYKAVDDCGNESATYDQVVNLIDNEAPVVTITCPADAALLADENCSADTSTDALGTATFTATDNCDDALTLELSHVDVQVDGCAGSYTITRTWTITATDHCGLSSSISCDQLITVSDETNPTIDLAAANETVECDGAGNLAALDAWLEDNGGAEASDNCTAELTWTNDFDALSDLCGATGSATVIFTATDDCGNASSTTATFTIEDTTAPSITAENEVDVPCDEYDAETPYGDYAATDGCSAVTTTISDLYFSGSCEGSYQRTYTATDACGNSSEFIQIINLTDEEAPTFTIACPADVTLSADENCGADTSAETHGLATFADVADNCDADVEMTVTYEDATSTPCDGSLVITRTFTITGEDNCENITTQSCTQTITVNDDTDPSITAPADVTVECDGMGNQAALDAFLAGATASDNCSDVTIEHDFTALSDDCGATGSATVIFTATDACGNSSSASATFTIEDSTAPSIDAAAMNLTVECDGMGNVSDYLTWQSTYGGAAASDACSGVTWSHEVLETGDDCGGTVGYSIVEFTATDDCGNASSTTATFTIEDTTAPTIDMAAADETVECDGDGNTNALNAWLDNLAGAAASDICGGVTWSHDFDGLSDLCGATGAATVTFTATDDCGNASSTSATFTIEDTTAPTWNSYDVYSNAACEDLLDPTDPTLVPISADDICGGVNYSIEAYQLSGGCPGTWMRVWTATDECGNASEPTEQYVQLYDNLAPTPVITCPAAYIVDADAMCEADVTTAAAGMATATATDNCAAEEDILIEITHSDSEISSLCEGQYSFTRTFTATATDECDNVASVSCDQLITVEDNTAPSIDTLAVDMTVECDGAGNTEALAAWLADNGGAAASDNCSDITWSHSDATLSDLCAATGAVTVTFTATDDCGNASSTSATFTIEDTTAPAFSGDFEVTISCDEWACDADALEALGVFSIDEACGDYTLEASCVSFSGGCVTPVGAYQANYTATDECGNVSTFSQIVILSDDVKPVPAIECPEDITLEADANCLADLDPSNTGMATGSATDNCDAAPEVVVTYMDGPITDLCAGSYSFTRTFTATATDHCENEDSISCDQLITVTDVTAPDAPVMSGPADAEVFLDADCATDASPATTGEATATADDNCDAAPSIEITYADSDPVYTCLGDDAAEGSYTFVRTWMAVATDDCDNEGAASTYEQTITVTDNLDPTFDGSANAYSIACDEYSETTQYAVMAADNCDSDVTIIILSNQEVSGSCAGSILRTYQAEDDCGNTSTFEQVIDLLDEVDPVVTITCPADADLTADALCQADTSIDALGNASFTAMDNCDADLELTLSHEDVLTAGCAGSYTIVRTFTITAEDHCENTASASCSQTITVSDATAPSIDAAAMNLTVECDGMGNVSDYLTWQSTYGGAAASDACSGVTWSHEVLETGDDCGGTVGYSIVEFTATDDCGNASSTTATFTIEDTTAPSITAENEVDVPCDEYDAETPYGDYAATDGCSAVTTTISDLYFSGSCEGSYQRTYTATDACGNSSEFIQIINLTDEEAPTFTIACPADVTLSADENCGADTSAETHGLATFADVADNCDADVEMTVTYEDATSTPCDGSLVITRTFTITGEDNCENITTQSCTQTITVNDDTDPSITAPADVTVECDGMGNQAALDAFLAGATASDNCSDVTIEHDFTALSDDCGATGSATVIFTATDACGNSSSASATFTIEDSTAPSIDAAAMNLTVECDGMGNVSDYLTWQSTYGGAAASDACSGVTWSHEVLETGDDCGGTVGYSIVEFTATDDCGNASSTTATFTIEDTTAPSITAENEVDVPCDEYDAETPYGDYAATDGCSAVTTTISDLYFSGSCEGSYQRTYTATDACGNSSEFIQIINLTDEEAPTFTIACPADVTLSADENCGADTSAETHGLATFADVADNCDADVEMTVTYEDATSTPCDGSLVITRTFTITGEDNCENITTQSCTQTITVNDDTDPSITAPADVTVECDGMGNQAALDAFLAGATASDNCSDVTIEHDFTALSDDCGATGSATVIFTATDACGNSSSASATFTIEDSTAPSIDAAAMNLTVECDGMGNVSDYLTWQSTYGGAAASDACSGVTWSHEVLETGDDCGGTVGYSIVEFTATDDCGNASSTTATFTIEDTTAPSITAENEVDVPCDEYDAETPYGDYAATDGCSAVTTTISDLYFSGSCEGSYQRTYTATDACGNSSEFIQIINLTDEEAPTFTIACPADVTLSADENCGADTSAETHGLATFADVADNCDADVEMTVTYEDATSTPCDGSLVITRTFTITGEDNCENITTQSCTQTITVNDDTDPSITAPADVTVECDGMGNQAALDAFLAGATASDNCSDVTIEHDFTALSDDCGATGSATVIFTATDACGNSSSASATFTIEDTTAPSLSIEGPANQDLEQNATCDIDTSLDALGTVTYEAGDDCGSASVEITHADSDALYTCAGDDALLEGSYTFIRTFTVTATDQCGLSTSLTYDQTITVTDNLAPVFTDTEGVANGDVQSVCCESHLGEVTIPDAVEPTFTDNCDSDVAYTPTETYVGDYAPTDEVDLFCLSNTPAAFEDGETCNGYDPHSLRIFSLPGGAEFYTAAAPGLVAHNADGTWTLTQSVVAADGSNAGWDITVTYGAALGWDDWSNQAFPTGYKRDCGNLIDDHENWEYRIMEFGSMSGTGDYYGSDLILSHAPSNNYYAFQLGLGANNMNNEYGYSGWFTYSGEFQGNTIMGSGDLFGDLDCCLPWSLEREYTIADDCGNEASFAYSVSVNGDDCEGALDGPAVSGSAAGDHAPVVIGGAGEVMMGKTPIRVTNLQPNPTNDVSQLGFMVDQTMRIRVDLVGMDGALVSELYEGIAQSGVNHTLDIDAGTLTNGMYQIRLSSNAYLVVKKLLVTE